MMLEQAIPITGSKPSLVYTGMGEQIYHQTPLNQQSPVDGVVDKLTDDFIVIDTGKTKRLIKRYEDYNTADHTSNKFVPEVKVGQEVKKGDNIFVSNSFKNKDLSLGCELLTAYTTFYALILAPKG